MKKRNKIIILALLLTFAVCGIFAYQFLSVYFSGEIKSEWLLTWNDETYVNTTFVGDIGRVVGIVPEGRYRLYSMKGDADNNFIFAESWGTRYKYVKADYTIPIDGEITIVYVRRTKMDSEAFCNAIEQILNGDSETFETEYKDIYIRTEKVWVGYEGCPVATEPIGFIGIIDDKWVFISSDEFSVREPDKQTLTCQIIDDALIPILKEYPLTYSNIAGE